VIGLSLKALNAVIGDYKAQFGQRRDYLYEVYKKNPSITIKIKAFKIEMINMYSSFCTFVPEH